MDEFYQTLKYDDLYDMVAIQFECELNSSSRLDEAVLEDAEETLHSLSGTETFKTSFDPWYPLVYQYQDVLCHDPTSFLAPERGVRHEIDLVPGTKILLHGDGLFLRNSTCYR